MRRILAALTLLSLTGSAQAAATNIYLAQSAIGAANGTSCANAVALAGVAWSAGTTYHLCGTITSQVAPNASGTSGSPITILFETGAMISRPACGATGCIDINGLSYITLDGSPSSTPCGVVNGVDVACNGTIQATNSGTGLGNGESYGVYAQSGCTNCEIRNLNIVDMYVHTNPPGDVPPNNYYGIYISGANNHIHNNVFHDDAAGIVGIATVSNEFDHNQIYNINWGIFLSGTAVNGINGVLIHDNDVHDWSNWDTTADAFHHDGFIIAGNDNLADEITHVDMYNNYIHGSMSPTNCCGTAFIFVNDGNHVRAYNNLLVANSGEEINNGWIFYWSPGALDSNDAILNNTVIGGSSGGSDGACIYVEGDASMRVENNIGSDCDLNMWYSTSPSTTFTALNNNVYQGSTLQWRKGSNYYNTLTAWQTAAGGDAQAQATTTGLSLDSSDKPQAGSIAIGAGANLTSLSITSLNSDKAGMARPATGAWDAGAYQFASVASGPAANVYIAQSAAGAADGSSCANTKAVSFFNTASNWGTGPGEIGPGTTVHLCGTITTNLTVNGSGTSGNVIEILFEKGASITQPTCNGTCLNLGNYNYLLVDGGTPCGWNVATNSSEGTCNGVIQDTANGGSLAHHNGDYGIDLGSGSNIEIRNIGIYNLYPPGSPVTTTDTSPEGSCINLAGPNSIIKIHDMTCHDTFNGVNFDGGGNYSGISQYNTYFYDLNHTFSGGANTYTVSNVLIYGNFWAAWKAWDTYPGDSWHHDGIYIWGASQSSPSAFSGWNVYNNIFGGAYGLNMNSIWYIDNTVGTTGVNFFNNVLAPTDAQPNGSGYLGMFPTGASTYNLYNNVWIAQNGVGIGCWEGSGVNGTSLTLSFENNVMQNCNASFMVATKPLTFSPIDYNVYATCMSGGSSSTPCWYYPSGSSEVAFTTWKSDVGGDSHSTYYPSTTAGLNSNYVPESGSVAIGAGANLTSVCSGQPNPGLGALCFDAAGNPRPQSGAWTAGAYQFSGSSSQSPCDVNGDGAVNILDVQLEVNMALGLTTCTNPDGVCNVTGVQRVVNAAAGGTCVSP